MKSYAFHRQNLIVHYIGKQFIDFILIIKYYFSNLINDFDFTGESIAKAEEFKFYVFFKSISDKTRYFSEVLYPH